MDKIELYIKKIESAFTGSGAVMISNFADDHIAARPSLHPNAHTDKADISALVYSILRLPPQIFHTAHPALRECGETFP